jgi:hypothetical protein
MYEKIGIIHGGGVDSYQKIPISFYTILYYNSCE